MQQYSANDDGWFCGWWNGSPLQINCAERKRLYPREKYHFHKDFCEYYLVLNGLLVLKVDGTEITIKKDQMIMLEPGEKHKVVSVGKGCRYLTIKSKSYDNNKVAVNE